MINFEIKHTAVKPVIDKRGFNEKTMVEIEEFAKGKEILNAMYENYNLALNSAKIERGNKNWYDNFGIVIRKMISKGIDKNVLALYLIHHIVDTLILNDRVDVMNFIWGDKDYRKTITDANLKYFVKRVTEYLQSKIISYKKLEAVVIYDGPSSIENLQIFVLNSNNEWLPAEPEDKRTLSSEIDKKFRLKESDVKKLNTYVGFIGFENNKKYMVYKVKDTVNERSTGYRCDQSSKDKVIATLGSIIQDPELMANIQKDSSIELCVRQELTLRHLKETDPTKIWFMDTEKAIYNEFEKRDKK
jgi:hypothetical protein